MYQGFFILFPMFLFPFYSLLATLPYIPWLIFDVPAAPAVHRLFRHSNASQYALPSFSHVRMAVLIGLQRIAYCDTGGLSGQNPNHKGGESTILTLGKLKKHIATDLVPTANNQSHPDSRNPQCDERYTRYKMQPATTTPPIANMMVQ